MEKIGMAVACLLVVACMAEATQVRSGFESDFSGWTTQGNGWSITDKSVFEGKKAALCTIPKGDPAGLKACAFLVEKAAAGWVVKADFQVAGKTKDGSSLTASLVCIDAQGNILREEKKTLTNPPNEFRALSLPEVIVPSGTAETYLMLVVELKEPARSKEWWLFDNVVIHID